MFTDANQTTVVANIIAVIRTGIVDTILQTSTADRAVTTPVINQMLLFCRCGPNTKRFPLRSAATITAALTAFLATNVTSVFIRIATTPLYVECNN